MKIWLINPYGPLPEEGWRDYSFVTIGKKLADSGHEVVWWTSNFSHHFKTFRSASWRTVPINQKFSIELVPTTGYKKNVGLGRILRDLIFGFRLFWRAKKESSPDLIIYYESPLQFGLAAPALAKYHACPLVYDQMDLWPELILDRISGKLRGIVAFFLRPVFWQRKRVWRRLDGVIALARPYLDSVLDTLPDLKNKPHQLIYNGIDVGAFQALIANCTNVDTHQDERRSNTTAIFAGSLGPSYDIETLLQVAEMAAQLNIPLKIYIAGDGPMRQKVQAAADCMDTLEYLGRLAPADLACAYAAADIGLAAYSASSNVEMPDKFYDYLAAGLAIVNSLKGEVSHQIDVFNCGFQYTAGNANELFEKLKFLVKNPERLNELKRNARLHAFDFDSVVQHEPLTEFVKKVVAQAAQDKK